MSFWVILGVSIGVCFVLNLCVITLSHRFKLFVDSQESNKPQRFHTLSTPRAGGIGIFTVFLGVIGVMFGYGNAPKEIVLGLLVGGSLIFASGIIEDFHASLTPKIRLLLQCLGGGAFIGISGYYLQDLGFGVSLPFYIGIPFSLFAIVGIINAINIIDGFNGLAGGIVLIALICIFTLPIAEFYNPFLLSLIGAMIGFLLLNFPKGKIFLGDGGAYFLGFILASLLILITQDHLFYRGGDISPWFGIALLIYPFWEVIFSIFRRLKNSSPLLADNQHLHQLLYKYFKLTNPLTTLCLIFFNLPFIILAYLFCTNTIALCLLCLLFIFLYTLLYRKLRH